MKSLLLLALGMAFSIIATAQTYTGTGGVIKDDGTMSDFLIDINDLPADTLNEAFGLKEVCINLTHTWINDLEIHLISPSGANIMLTAQLGGDTDFYTQTCFTANAPQHILDVWSPFTGKFRPFSNVGNINNNQPGNGSWMLRIYDNYPFADGGDVISWSLTFGPDAPAPDALHGTQLPIIALNTNNAIIPNDPKIPGTFHIIFDETGDFNHFGDSATFSSRMEIEVRGSSSQGFPKKSFSFELQDEEGNDSAAELLGLPEEEDWILYAPYTDKSFLRDALTYQLGNDILGYSPRAKAVELYINGDYQGVYWLEEKIKRDKNRVDIKKLNPEDTTGNALTGGYIIKVDRNDGPGTYFVSNYEGSRPDGEIQIVYEEPEGPDMHPLQQEYIANFVHSFENALYSDHFADPDSGYQKFIDIGSVIDYFILNEFGHNVDAYRLSTFFYKDRDSEDTRMHMGPMWDFNLAYGNVDYCNCQFIEGWAYINSTNCDNTPLWWGRFLEDSTFSNALQCRYQALRRDLLSNGRIDSLISVWHESLNAPAITNYKKWPILNRYIWPNFFIGHSYGEEINYLKQWTIQRLEWMDDNMPGECIIIATDDPRLEHLSLYPNPADDIVTISNGPFQLSGTAQITDINGREVFYKRIDGDKPELHISLLPAGIYLLRYQGDDGAVGYERLVIVD